MRDILTVYSDFIYKCPYAKYNKTYSLYEVIIYGMLGEYACLMREREKI